MSLKTEWNIIFVLLILNVSLLIFNNYNDIFYKYTKVNQHNFYALAAGVSDSNLSNVEKQYLKLAFLNYSYKPASAYDKSISDLIHEGENRYNDLLFKRK